LKVISYKTAVLSLLLAVLAPPVFAASRYTVTDLGAGVIPSALNNYGDVVGTIVHADAAPQAFIYGGGVVVGLGQLGGTASWGLGINDSADIVGSVCMDDVCTQNPYWGAQRHGFLAKEGKITDLGSVAGMMEGAKINNSGLVLGTTYTDNIPKIILYDSNNAKVTDITPFRADNHHSLSARGLNNLGEAVFVENLCGSYECSYSYLFSDGALQVLPPDRFVAWDIADINDQGEMVGTSGDTLRGVLYYQDLTFIPDANLLSFAPEAINNEGVMLGRARDVRQSMQFPAKRPVWLSHKPAPDLYSNPAIREKSNITLLQERLVKSQDEWVLENVFDINDKGQIIGYGKKNGDPEHGFLLTPVQIKEGSMP
jgi:probable HAF family extracellular repeat protein